MATMDFLANSTYHPSQTSLPVSSPLDGLENTMFRQSVPYPTPQLIAYTTRAGFSSGIASDAFLPYGIDNGVQFGAPKAPVRFDTYNQSMIISGSQTVIGSAPSRGIYTGVEDPCHG